MTYKQEVLIFLERNSSINNQKSVRAIAESLNISEEDAGFAVHALLKTGLVQIGENGNPEGLQYYI